MKTVIDNVAEAAGITKKQTKHVIRLVLNSIVDEVMQHGSIRLYDFGTFKLVDKAARKGRNPATGAEIQIEAKKVVKFVPAKALKDHINR